MSCRKVAFKARGRGAARGRLSGMRKGFGQVLMVLGAACVTLYLFTSPRGTSPALVRVGGLAFYVGVVALLAGAVVRWFARR
ncbi:MAG TPA: hypothetical protein VEY09_14825 [Pyrinomonadaceae bacterium]|nr:hypothetical protein [Pyrinomonadaceae bacterium]